MRRWSVRIRQRAPSISCIVLENGSVHLPNALSLTSLSAGTRNIVVKVKMGKLRKSPYKRLTLKANNSRAMAIPNKTIQLIQVLSRRSVMVAQVIPNHLAGVRLPPPGPMLSLVQWKHPQPVKLVVPDRYWYDNPNLRIYDD